MKQLNRYYRRSKISERKFRQLVRYFALDFTASDVARLTRLTRKSVTAIFLKLRERIALSASALRPSVSARWKLTRVTSALVACEANAVVEHPARPDDEEI